MSSEMHAVTGDAVERDDVIALAKKGDRAAIEELFHLLDPDLRRYLGSVERDDADDLCGEVWLGVARSLHAFVGDLSGFRSWVFTIAQRRLIDHRRRRSYRQTDVADLRDTSVADEHGADEDVLAQLSGHDAARLVRSLLPPSQADVVLLRVLGQLDVDEVARAMGRSENWVRVTQHRGLRRLAERLRIRTGAGL